MRIGQILLIVVSVGVLLATTSREAAAEASRVAVVDVERVLHECRDGLRVRHSLQVLYASHQEDLDRRQRELLALRARLDGGELSRAERPRLEQMYQSKLAELQAIYTRYQQELNQAEAQQTQRILRRIREVVEIIRREGSYAVVVELNPGQPPPRGPGAATDVTQRVITQYETRFGAGGH